MMLKEILRRGWYMSIDDAGGGGDPPEDDTEETVDLEDADEADLDLDEDDQGPDPDQQPDPQPAVDPVALAQAIVDAQRQAQQTPQGDDKPEFDWSDPGGSVQRIVAAATSGITKDVQDRRALEDGIMSSLKGRSQEALDFARGVLANTPTDQLRHPDAAKTLKWMAIGFESENVPKKVKSTVLAEPAVPKKSAAGGSAEVQRYIKEYDEAFPHLKGRMTVERAKKILEGGS